MDFLFAVTLCIPCWTTIWCVFRRRQKISFVCLTCLLSAAGTRIIYDRKFLLDRRNSPIAQTPPAHLPIIPGVTSQNILNENKKNEANNINNHDGKPGAGMFFPLAQIFN